MPYDVIARPLDRSEVTRDFLERAVTLLNRAFGAWPRIVLPEGVSAVDHLDWKANGPLPGFPAFLIAEVDGQLAGSRTTLARRVLVRSEPKLFLHFVDAGVDPAFQGRGANRATQQLMHDVLQPQFDLSIDDSTNPHMVHGRTRLGDPREFGNEVRPAVLPLDAWRLARSEGGRLPVPLAALRLRLVSTFARITAGGERGGAKDFALRTVSEFDSRFDAFCAEASTPFDFICERDAAFLNWRYADPRAGAFTIRVAERAGRLVGYVVTKVDGETTHVVDLLITPGEMQVASALIRDAVDHARAAGSASVSCWTPDHHPYRNALQALGFFSLGDTAVLYRPVSMPAAQLAFLEERDASMHFTFGDTDFV